MMAVVPAQPAPVPGGPELVVIVLIALLMFAPIYIAWKVWQALRTGPSSSELGQRVALLEHEVAELQERLDERDDGSE
ncbi:MAG: twin-arginine translocase TatA/TatE family subunit [Haloarculaceae archaeon]